MASEKLELVISSADLRRSNVLTSSGILAVEATSQFRVICVAVVAVTLRLEIKLAGGVLIKVMVAVQALGPPAQLFMGSEA